MADEPAPSTANIFQDAIARTPPSPQRNPPVPPSIQPTDAIDTLPSSAIESATYVAKARNLYGMTERATPTPESYLQNVFSPAQLAPAQETFPPLHIEFLLDQSQDLLSRAIQDRQAFSDLAAKSFQIKLELEEFSRLDAIHKRERDAGAYKAPYQHAYQDYLAEFYATAEFKSSANKVDEMQSDLRDKYSRIIALRRFLGWLSALPLLARDFEGPPQPYQINGEGWNVTRNKAEHFTELTTEQAVLDTINRLQGLESQLHQLLASSQAAEQRAKGQKVTSDWLYKNIGFRNERLAVAQDLNNQKLRAVTTDGGSLNFSEQMNQIKSRFTSNTQKAWARMSAIKDTIKLLYGFSQPLPNPQEPLTFLDQAWLWVQNATDHMIAYNRFDQNTVMQFSVQGLVNNQANWDRGIQTGQFAFSFNQQHFAGQRNIRLRGLSMSVVKPFGDRHVGTWSGSVTPPTNTQYIDLAGHAQTYRNANAKPLKFGRALVWNPESRASDVLGVVALHNTSPWGDWKINLDAKSSLYEARDHITDMLLELHVAYRPT